MDCGLDGQMAVEKEENPRTGTAEHGVALIWTFVGICRGTVISTLAGSAPVFLLPYSLHNASSDGLILRTLYTSGR